MSKYLLGIDLGSSSIKACLLEAASGTVAASAISPSNEMQINSPQDGWAEQDPEVWWQNVVVAVRKALTNAKAQPDSVMAIGISYQMHGLVLVDRQLSVIRPSIIWCDSRAVTIGDQAFDKLGAAYCTGHLLNSPGNFTASKLKWVKDHEPEAFDRIHKIMLPGDYLAMRLTDELATTISGLSEGIMWDYKNGTIAQRLLDYYGIDEKVLPPIHPTFSKQGKLSSSAAGQLGLKAGIPVSYRAGDQPNNAFSLNALEPGHVAATAGTSGVVYAIVDKPIADAQSRVNTFVHVNHNENAPRYGVLLCVNGTGILNSWLRKLLQTDNQRVDYELMNSMAAKAAVGSDGLRILPFGNGAERMLQNINIHASVRGLDLNRHDITHISRAAQEGIVFALGYGFEVMHTIGIRPVTIRAGHTNMFLSPVFCDAFTNVTGCVLELYNTDGAQGAARGAGVGIGYYKNTEEAFGNLKCIKKYEPDAADRGQYREAFDQWKIILNHELIKTQA